MPAGVKDLHAGERLAAQISSEAPQQDATARRGLPARPGDEPALMSTGEHVAISASHVAAASSATWVEPPSSSVSDRCESPKSPENAPVR